MQKKKDPRHRADIKASKNIKLDNLFDAISSVLQGRSLSLQLFGLPHKFSHRNYIYIYYRYNILQLS